MFEEKYDIKYNKKQNELIIMKKKAGKASIMVDGKYGTQMGKTINENPICIKIPDPDILFGFKINEIENFARD